MTEDEQRERANQYAIALILIGVALSRNGDSKRVAWGLLPELLEGHANSAAMRAIQDKDAAALKRFLASIGVQMLDGELAVDALMREQLAYAKQKLTDRLSKVHESWKAEEERAVARVAAKREKQDGSK